MSFDNRFKTIITKAAEALHNEEKFVTALLANRAQKVASSYPTDPTVVSMANFLASRAEKHSLISRAELKMVYQKFHTNNNKFANSFSHELGIFEAPAPKVAVEPLPALADEMSLADPVLAACLRVAFDKEAEFKPFSKKAAETAEKLCFDELNSMNLAPAKVSTITGRHNVILCEASYPTSKGTAKVLIPCELKDNRVLSPNCFMTGEGPIVLAKELVAAYLDKQGSMNKPYAEPKLASGDAGKGWEDPVLETEKEVQEFAKQLASAAGVAEFALGKVAVNQGRSMIKTALEDWGFKHTQIKVNDCNDDTVYFVVAVDRSAGFTVPVKVINKVAQPPQVMITSDGSLTGFSHEEVSNVLNAEDPGMKAAAMASVLYGRQPAQLIEDIREAAVAQDFDRAEEALNVLKQAGDVKSFAIGFSVYEAGLKGKLAKTASVKSSGCKLQITAATSQHKLCGHTNLPLNKVYQNSAGNCLPLYRRDMEVSSTSDEFRFITSKVFSD